MCHFFKRQKKYTNVTPLIYNNNFIPFEDFFKHLGVEITNNCEYRLIKEQRVFKARKAIFSLRKVLSTAGNFSVDLAMKLFSTKIESILTYGSIIWGIESTNNNILIEGNR